MNLRHLRYFVALAREGNHQRAAAACHVTQPTLSEAVRQLERELGVPLVARNGQRFGGLTMEGDRVLAWARRILADEDALDQELAEIRGGLSGELRFGIIPAAIPMAPRIINPFCKTHPQVTLKIISCTSIEIQRGFDEGTMDAAMTYLDNEPLHRVQAGEERKKRSRVPSSWVRCRTKPWQNGRDGRSRSACASTIIR